MKLFLFLFLLINTKVFCQWPFFYQSSSLYKQNHVKTRVASFMPSGKSEIVDSFDYNGMLVKQDFFTNFMYIHYGKLLLKYDDKGNLVKETQYRHKFYDSTRKKWSGYIDTLETIIEHDQMNRVVKKIYTDKSDKVASEIEYSYDPYIENSITFFNGHPQISIIYYDEYHNVVRIINKKVLDNGDTTETWRKEYKNVYDEKGRIKKCKIEDIPPSKTNMDFDNIKDKYYYLDNGLLESRVFIHRGGEKFKETYTYTFW